MLDRICEYFNMEVSRILDPVKAKVKRPPADGQDLITLYRRHAARAMADERWSVAEIFLDRIIEASPRNTEAWLMKGLVSQHCRDDVETAVRCFRQVITLGGYEPGHPHVERARRSLGRLLSSWA